MQVSFYTVPMPLDQPQTDDPVESFKMPLGEHIEDLRKYLIRALIGLVVAMVPAFIFGFDLIGLLLRPLLEAMDVFGYTPQTITPDASAGFFMYLLVGLVAGLILASPWILYQLWKFVAAGLYTHEKRVVYILAPFSTVMVGLAVAFAYYVMLPVCVFFFFRFSTGFPVIDASEHGAMIRLLERSVDTPAPPPVSADGSPMRLPVYVGGPAEPAEGEVWIDRDTMRINVWVGGGVRTLALMSPRAVNPYTHLDRYISFATMLLLGIVIAFQMPVAMLIVGWTGLVDPKRVVKMRKYAMFVCAIAGAVLTPADPFSMFILWIPLYLLFEFGLLLMRMVDPYKTPPEEL